MAQVSFRAYGFSFPEMADAAERYSASASSSDTSSEESSDSSHESTEDDDTDLCEVGLHPQYKRGHEIGKGFIIEGVFHKL